MSTTTFEFCVVCGDDRDMRHEQRAVEYTVRNEKLTLTIPVTICPNCGTEEVEKDFGHDPVELAYEAYRKNHDLLSPQQIKETRERYCLSQKSFAKLLGMSEATINRYEQGALQDAAHDIAIRAFQHYDFVRDALSRRGGNLSDWQRARAEGAIKQKIAVGLDPGRQISMPHERTDRTGYKAFDIDRYAAAVVWFCSNMSAVTPTKLNKLVFYLDFLHFKRHAVSFTGSAYRRIQFGPVPADYRGIQRYMEGQAIVEVVEREYQNGNTGEEYRPGEKAKHHDFPFNGLERATLEMIRGVFENVTPLQISERSHQELAWLETPDKDFISYNLAHTLSVE